MEPDLRAVLDAADDEQRESALREAIVSHGFGVYEALADGDEAFARHVVDSILGWFEGMTFSDRADEPERRVRAAEEALDDYGHVLTALRRYYAQAILALPEGVESRDEATAIAVLRDHLATVRADGDAYEVILTIAALLGTGAGSEDLLDEGLDWFSRYDGERSVADFQLAAENYAADRHLEARDAGDEAEAERWLQRKQEFVFTGDDPRSLASQAAMFDSQDKWAEAADLYYRIVEQTELSSALVQPLAVREGHLRLLLGDLERSAEHLEAVAPHAQHRYLTAVRDDEKVEAAEWLHRCAVVLAAALYSQGDVVGAMRAMDRPRGVLGRYERALRATSEGRDLLRLRREIDAAARGAGRERAELLERYRRLRPQLDTGAIASPSLAQVGALLDADELVLTVGIVPVVGTVAVVVAAGDRDRPHAHTALEDGDWYGWLEMFALEDGNGYWVVKAVSGGAVDDSFDAGLVRTIDVIDERLGTWLRRQLDLRGACRLTIVADGILQVVPWAALPSLRDVDVTMTANLSAVVADRETAAKSRRSMLLVTNPTLDLHVAGAACRAAADLLPPTFVTTELTETSATESAVVGAVDTHGLLVFAGHGRVAPGLVGLELHPLELADGSDPFPQWAVAVTDWQTGPDEESGDAGSEDDMWTERYGTVPGLGRLVERSYPGTARIDRRLEHATGTLLGTYADGRLLRLSELWSATDMLLADTFTSCRLAILVACSSAAGLGRGEDSPVVPISLQLAGVDTVVGTRWEVPEGYAGLWTIRFIELLASAADTAISVPALVRRTSADLAAVTRAEARARLLDLADGTDDPFAAIELEAYAHHLDVAHPFDTRVHADAFYVTGRPTLEFQEVTT